MLLDFDDASTPLPAKADVCILGAGAAGIVLATEFAAAGRSVLVLEGGGLDLEPRSQSLYCSEVAAHPHRGIHDGRFRTFGGSTTRWGGQMLPLAAQDFAARDWVPGSGWPFSIAELLPWYERAHHVTGLRRVERDDATVRHALGITDPDLTPEFHQLYSRWLPERNLATLHARTLRESLRITVLFHASAVALNLNSAADALTSIIVRGFSGRTADITANTFVLALGGIESTRLLLQPTVEGTPPWQRNGLLGRHFQDHLTLNAIPVTRFMERPADSRLEGYGLQPVHKNLRKDWGFSPGGSSHLLDAHRAQRLFGYVESRGFRYHNKIVLAAAEQQRQRTLNVAGTLSPFARENHARDAATETLRSSLRSRRLPPARELLPLALHAPGIALDRLRSEASRWRRLMLTVHAEQSPRSASTLSLTNNRDALGLLRTRLHWVISDEELATLRAYVRTATEVFARQRLATITPPRGFYTDDALLRSLCTDSYHHMGGTVMSTNPALGIVDADLRLHGIRNAWVCSSSVFPTSGFSNPTHTLIALALRLAGLLAAQTPGAPSVRFTGRVGEHPPPSTPTPESCHPEASPKDPLLDAARTPGAPSVRFTGRVGEPPPPSTHESCHPEASPKDPLLDAARTPSGALSSVPQLGFGCAYLLSPGLDRAASRRLLDAAFDAGIRHFDAARLYGMGHTESLLGDFLADHPDATITTKFGLHPPTTTERLLMSATRRLGREWHRNDKARFTANEARASLHTSLRALRRDRIDLFLLHEATPEDLVHDDLLAFLLDQRSSGIIGDFGIGGSRSRVTILHRDRRPYTPVLQFDQSLLDPGLDLPGSRAIHYRVFAPAAATLQQRFIADSALARCWSAEVDADLLDPQTLAGLLLRASLDANPKTLTLFSARTEDRIFTAVTAATDPSLTAPAQRLLRLARS